jgi:hypothetical protein
MSDVETGTVCSRGVPEETPASAAPAALLVDSAISHCEKLRRIVQLEEWISVTPDTGMLAPTRRKWQEERARLLAELHLDQQTAAGGQDRS